MANVKFFLDTNALLYLSGLEDPELSDFKNRIEASKAELCVTSVQVDEVHEREFQNYQQKIKKALESLANKGINAQHEDTKIFVWGVTRWNYHVWTSKKIGKLYDELRKEIEECEKAKGTKKTLLNIVRDATIAVSSLDHDFFITCDRCLFDSWRKVIGKHIILRQQFKVPKIIYAERSPKQIATHILGFLS